MILSTKERWADFEVSSSACFNERSSIFLSSIHSVLCIITIAKPCDGFRAGFLSDTKTRVRVTAMTKVVPTNDGHCYDQG